MVEQDSERRRLAVDLHDHNAQVLAAALMMLRAAGHGDGAGSGEAADQARALISETISKLRALAGDLSPRALEQHGLTVALEQLSESLTGINLRVDGGFTGRLPFEAESTLYRVAQETLSCLIESGARDIDVIVTCAGGTVAMSIGCGHAAANTLALQTRLAHEERLRLLGGRLHVVHSANQRHVFQAKVPTQRALESY